MQGVSACELLSLSVCHLIPDIQWGAKESPARAFCAVEVQITHFGPFISFQFGSLPMPSDEKGS
jgi:hypothetical protein